MLLPGFPLESPLTPLSHPMSINSTNWWLPSGHSHCLLAPSGSSHCPLFFPLRISLAASTCPSVAFCMQQPGSRFIYLSWTLPSSAQTLLSLPEEKPKALQWPVRPRRLSPFLPFPLRPRLLRLALSLPPLALSQAHSPTSAREPLLALELSQMLALAGTLSGTLSLTTM